MISKNAQILTSNNSLSLLAEPNDQNLINQLIKSILEQVPAIKQDIEQNRTIVVDTIVNRGFSIFKEQASFEQYNGVEDAFFHEFLNNLRAEIDLPFQYQAEFDQIMQVTLFSTSNVWVVFNVIFSVKEGGNCKFVCVMATHDQENKKTNWLLANVGATFELAPDLMVVQTSHSYAWGAFSKSEEKIVTKPASITMKELEVIFEFFEVVAFERFAEILNISNTNALVAGNEKPLGDVMAALTLVKGAITIVTETWTSIVNAFKTTKTSELKEILQRKGFSYFSEAGEMQKITGLVESYYDTFANELMGRLQVPDGKKTAFLRNYT